MRRGGMRCARTPGMSSIAQSGAAHRAATPRTWRLLCLVGAAIAGVACGSSNPATWEDGGQAGDAGRSRVDAHVVKIAPLTEPDAQPETLHIEPMQPVLKVSSPGAKQQLHAYLTGSTTPVQAAWTVDTPTFGTIDSNGLFTASGLVGGQVTIEAMSGGLHAQTVLTVNLALTDNPGAVSTATQKQLLAGGVDAGADSGLTDPGFVWLYPYDATVFPRGLAAPTLQFGGVAPDAVYVHVSFSSFDYQGFYGTSNPGQVTFAPQLWETLTATATATASVTVQLTKISAGQVTGPITEAWTIAQGSLKGSVYYESRYSTPTDQGATMRIRPGASQPDVLLGNCTVCHYVSADGSTIVATLDTGTPITSAAYNLKADAGVVSQSPNETYTFGALYKDGSLLMSMGTGAGEPGLANDGAQASHLWNTATGAQIPAPGWDSVITNGMMPTFSPSGSHIVFNHYDTGMGHSLAMMSFDVTTSTFSGLLDIATDPNHYLGWPAFTPDEEWVTYDADNRSDYLTWSAVTAGSGVDAKSDIQIAHLPSGTTAALDALNGVRNGQYYLPFGETAEGHMNYDATVLPVAAGGYYWVVFTSRREYGNTINNPDPYYNTSNQTPGALPWRKKLWVAALDIDDSGHPTTSAHDISHPAFYLPGQDLQTGNYRGFWVLNPCSGNGSSCGSGDDCCSGFCRTPVGDAGVTVDAGSAASDGAVSSDAGADVSGGGSSVVAATGTVCVVPQSCANEYEKCTTASDCCQAGQGFLCINGFCAQPAPTSK
jgi:hypothetical protein